ncbi:hypothetical protein [Paludibaculum fermentans]|uniref:Uncharacterized protein n=1 Tax=Paludibaculum fermentans TaxID=1473598 RepID=A0A7S7NVT7_PALFE|nr:hypothetical protein [Paludibaculum fermentans]QOY90675.1 hypothetical protein IRI77_12230 [Paludibaculum fermentans]
MTRAQWYRAAAVIVVAAGGLLLMSSMGRLQWPSVLVYSGLVTFACGLFSILVPARWLGFARRLHSLAAGAGVGAVLLAAGMFWPLSAYDTPSPTSRIDAFLPAYHFQERHELVVNAPVERVREALRQVTFSDIGAMQTLGRIRGFVMGGPRRQAPAQAGAAPMPVLDVVKRPESGFFTLDDTPHEFVFGLAGQPWNNKPVRVTAEEFRSWRPPGQVKVAANFLMEDAGGGRTRLITETRIAATDEAAQRTMARYWALVYPGSGMIRWGLLHAIQARAERP